LRDLVSQVRQSLQELPKTSEAGAGEATDRQEAQEHLEKAMAQMSRFQDKLAEARYGTGTDREDLAKASDVLDLANNQLDLAKEAIEGELTLSNEQVLAKEAQELAEELAKLAEALDKSVKGVEREQMLARLEEARRMLELIMNEKWEREKGRGNDSQAATHRERPIGAGSADGDGGYGVIYGDTSVGSVRQAPTDLARALAREFWSIAIKAKKRKTQVIEDDPSDAAFYELERDFFEDAARFEGPYLMSRPRD
jgi:RNA polymerase-interacting CarD/CdnL/TRCF family regulator